MIDLSMVTSAIVAMGVEAAWENIKRREAVLKVLKSFKLDPSNPPTDFDGIYAYTLIEYGVERPEPILNFFRNKFVREAFQQSFYKDDPSILDKEAEGIIQWNEETGKLGQIDYDPRREFAAFSAVFHAIVDRTRTPAEVKRDQKLDNIHNELHQTTGEIIERLDALADLSKVREERDRLIQNSPLEDLAQNMRAWFQSLNYSFEHYEERTNTYFEWIINVPARRGYDRVLLHGIDREAKVSDIVALRKAVDKHKTKEGWLVAIRRVSQAAREVIKKPENSDLFCYTFDELLDENADFSSYLNWLKAEVKHRGIDRMYVPLACTKEEFDPVTRQKIGEGRYDERNGWIDGYIDRWLDDPAKEHISILGEFGTGKTWFVLHYAWVSLQRYQDAKTRGVERPRLPLVIPLRDYAKAVSVESLFSEFFFRKYENPLPGYSAFEQLNRMGKLLLIFDGFDEMADKIDRQKMINNFWELAKVVVPESKVLLTCRTEHFPEAKEGRALLNAEIRASTANLTGEPPQFEILELNHFNDAQIRQVLSLRTEPATVERVMRNRELLMLARRPIMVELILEALPDIRAGKPVDLSHVYLYAVRRKMERDIKEERTFTSLADKLYFLCELSWEMLSTNQMSLNYRLFPDRLRRLFGSIVQEQKDLDHWHYDMMGQTMLIRNADGDYSPAHRSLLEFFVAYKFAAELGVLRTEFIELAQSSLRVDTTVEPLDYTWSTYFQFKRNEKDEIIRSPKLYTFIHEPIELLATTLGAQPLTEAVLSLMKGMVDPKWLWQIVEATRDHKFEEVGYCGGNAATLLRYKGQSFKGVHWAGTVLVGANLKNADLTEADLHATNLGMADLTDVTLENADLRESDLRKTTLAEENAITFLAASPVSNQLAASSHDHTIKVWDIDKGLLVMTLRSHTDSVLDVAFNRDGQELASASLDGTVRIWDAKTGALRALLQEYGAQFSDVVYSPDSKYVISGEKDGTVRIWSRLELIEVSKIEVSGEVFSVELDPKGILLAIGTDIAVDVWDLTLKEPIFHLPTGQWGWNSVVFSPKGDFLVVTGNKLVTVNGKKEVSRCYLKVIDTVSWKEKKPFRRGYQSFGRFYQPACDPTGEKIICGTSSRKIPVWDIPSGKEILCINHPRGPKMEAVTFDSSGHYLVTGDYDGKIYVWSAQTGEFIKVLESKMNCQGTKISGAKGLDEKVSSGQGTLGAWLLERGAILS